MCIRVVEQFSVCRCVYYVHGVDQCNSYGMRGHYIQDKVILVGHTCRDHSYSMTSSQTSSSQSSPAGPAGPAILHGPRFTGQASGIGAQIRQLQAQQELYGQQQQEAAAIAYMAKQQQQQYYAQYNGYSR
ncbi:hypothetical protein EV426DRAFT_699178 [Tirmania nivea]|nr:hypothetical protein EV426DRAFT_699178 [Tirmania nivea]